MYVDFQNHSYGNGPPYRLFDRSGEEIVLGIQTINLQTGMGTCIDHEGVFAKYDVEFDPPLKLYDKTGQSIAVGEWPVEINETSRDLEEIKQEEVIDLESIERIESHVIKDNCWVVFYLPVGAEYNPDDFYNLTKEKLDRLGIRNVEISVVTGVEKIQVFNYQ